MKRTTISLPDDVSTALAREARRRRVPVSQVAREAIESMLGPEDDTPRELSFIGIANSEGGASNYAEHFDGWLAENWIRDIEADWKDDAPTGGR